MNHSPVRILAVVLAFGLFTAACVPSQAAQPAQPTQTAQMPQVTLSSPTQTSPVQAEPPTAAPTTAAVQTSQTPVTDATPTGSGIKFTLVAGKSTASYKVREQLANRPLPNDAVGTTQSISGTVEVNPDGSTNPDASKFTVDLTTLQTDQQMRDNYVRRNVLETSKYPQAVFVVKQAMGLPNPLPASGQVSFKLVGDMTLHGVTKEITWDVTGTIDGGTASGSAITSFKFEDFGINQPRVPVVLSVVDNITLEVKGDIERATN